MKTRTIKFAVFLLFVTVSLFAGAVPHDHHHHVHHDPLEPDGDCVACTWHIDCVTDAPLVVTPIFYSADEVPLRHFSVTPVFVSVPLTSDSRAPPVASA